MDGGFGTLHGKTRTSSLYPFPSSDPVLQCKGVLAPVTVEVSGWKGNFRSVTALKTLGLLSVGTDESPTQGLPRPRPPPRRFRVQSFLGSSLGLPHPSPVPGLDPLVRGPKLPPPRTRSGVTGSVCFYPVNLYTWTPSPNPPPMPTISCGDRGSGALRGNSESVGVYPPHSLPPTVEFRCDQGGSAGEISDPGRTPRRFGGTDEGWGGTNEVGVLHGRVRGSRLWWRAGWGV